MASSTTTTSSSNSSSRPQLCVKGCGFYGNPATSNMCSKCYKDFQLNLTEERLSLLVFTGKPLNVTRKVHATDDADHTTSTSTSNNDRKKKRNRCQCCNKRVGLMGFECRCGGLFCGLHRYPEEHTCFFDYKTFGRLQLEKQNPLCGGGDKLIDKA